MDSTVTSETIPTRTGRIIQRLALGLPAQSEDLIDWREVAGVAMDVTGDKTPLPLPDGVAEEFALYVDRAIPAVADCTGLKLPAPLGRPVVFNRAEWIAVTARTIKPLMEPFLEEIVAGADDGGMGRFSKAALWGELGLILGYLARRVLGQYDISLIDPQNTSGCVFFIYPNIVETEKRLGVRGEEFRVWLALHEITHAFEFQAHPWVQTYISDLLMRQLALLRDKLGKGAGPVGGAGATDGQLGLMFSPFVWRELASVEENPVLAKTQALMSVLEGYSEYVMEKAGSVVGAPANIAEIFQLARGSKPLVNKLFERLIGLQIKIDQYSLGYRFISRAALSGDMELVNRLWEGPESLPTLTELDRPELWITRMLR